MKCGACEEKIYLHDSHEVNGDIINIYMCNHAGDYHTGMSIKKDKDKEVPLPAIEHMVWSMTKACRKR